MIDKPVAVTGTWIRFNSTADGGSRITIELDELQTFIVRHQFPALNTELAVAPLHVEINPTGSGS